MTKREMAILKKATAKLTSEEVTVFFHWLRSEYHRQAHGMYEWMLRHHKSAKKFEVK